MTKKELIESLSDLPDNTEVFVKGYEGGFDKIRSVNKILVVEEEKAQPWYYGAFSAFDYKNENKNDIRNPIEGVVLRWFIKRINIL